MTEKKDVRFGMVWTEGEAAALKEWCWANRIKSESAAIRALIADGITRTPPPNLPTPPRRTRAAGSGPKE